MIHPLHRSGRGPPFDSLLHRLDSRTKLVGALAFVVFVVSTPPRAYAAFAGYAATLAAVLAIGRVPIRYLVTRWLIVLPVVAATGAIPFLGGPDARVFLGVRISPAGLVVLWNVAVKALLAVGAMTVLTASTHFADVLEALRRARVPRVLIMMVGMAHRYLFVLADEAGRMKLARDARFYGGRWLWQAGVVGRMVGTLLLRSYERGERVYGAMLARGFDGTAPGGHPTRFGPVDGIVLSCWLAALLAVRLLVT